MSTEAEIDELLFGPSVPATAPTSASNNQNLISSSAPLLNNSSANNPNNNNIHNNEKATAIPTTGGIHFAQNDFDDDDDLDFLLGPTPTSSSSSNNNVNGKSATTTTTTSTNNNSISATPSKLVPPEQQVQAPPKPTFILPAEQNNNSNKNTSATAEKSQNGDPKNAEISNSAVATNEENHDEKTKDGDENAKPVPETIKERVLFTLLYALAPLTLLIVLLVLGFAKDVEGGICESQFHGNCLGFAIGSGGWTESSIFSTQDPENDLGCMGTSQACVSSSISVKELYSDANYERCWSAEENFFRMDSFNAVTTTASTTTTTTTTTTITTNVSSTSWNSSSKPKLGRIWIVPPIYELGNPELNLTRALNCCRFLPGGATGAPVMQIIVKAVVGALLDILINAFTAIPIIAKFLNIIMFPFNFIYMKIEMMITTKQAKKQASIALKEKSKSSTNLAAQEESLLSDEGEDAGTVEAGRQQQPTAQRKRRQRGQSMSQQAQVQVEEFAKMVEEYTEKAAQEQEQMMEDLNLHCWVDEVCFPSTLMIVKSVCLSVFGVYIAASEIMKPEYAGMTAWQKYNAYAANIINGDVFSGWLDISVQFFTFYSTQTDVYRQGVKIAALAPTIGMSLYVKFMFAPDKDHPAYKFFKFCTAARNGTLIIWLMYIAPYVTHICMSFFYYMPQIVVYYMTMVQAGGLICILIVKAFDVYGDNWREEVMRLHKIEKEEEAEAKRKKKEKKEALLKRQTSSTADEVALEIVTGAAATAQNSNENKNSGNQTATVEENDKTESSESKHHGVPLISSSALFWGQIRSFIGRYLMMVMYSTLVFYVYSLLCNWAVLLYDDYDRYGGASNYLLVVWDELSIRQMGCQFLQLQDAVVKGDRITYVDMFLGFF